MTNGRLTGFVTVLYDSWTTPGAAAGRGSTQSSLQPHIVGGNSNRWSQVGT